MVPGPWVVLERSQRVCTIPVDFAWSDVGTWASLGQELGLGSRQKSGPAGSSSLDESGNCVIGGDVLALESSGNLVWADKRMIALLGVDDLTVIETDDVILITKVERSSDVRMIVGELKRKGRDELT